MKRHGSQPVSLFNPDGRCEDPPVEIELPQVLRGRDRNGSSSSNSEQEGKIWQPREISVVEEGYRQQQGSSLLGADYGEINGGNLAESLSKKSRGELLLLFLSALDRHPDDKNTSETLTSTEHESLLQKVAAVAKESPQVVVAEEPPPLPPSPPSPPTVTNVVHDGNVLDNFHDEEEQVEDNNSNNNHSSSELLDPSDHLDLSRYPNRQKLYTRTNSDRSLRSMEGFRKTFQHNVSTFKLQDTIHAAEYSFEDSPFSESSYTLIYMCDRNSQGFWYGWFVYSIQMTAIALTLFDIIDPKDKENVFRLPPMVTTQVSIAQGVALFLALAYQQDMIESALKLQDGFYPEVQRKHPGATKDTWLFSCLAQLLSGILLLATIFVLTIQVDSVLNIMLNFAALHFMSEIDDLGFALAKMGFVTNKLQRTTLEVAEFKIPKRQHSSLFKRTLYYMVMIWLFVWFGWYKQKQLSGYYLQSYVYVQFGDSYNPKIHYYSGLLSSGNGWTIYSSYREYRDVGTQNVLLAYCEDERVWAFSERNDPCDYFAKSERTFTFDVTTIPASQWRIVDPLSRLQPFDSFSLVGRDCEPEVCQGECIDGLCHCPHHRFGMDCEFDNICPELVLHGESEPFPTATLRQYPISDQFQLLKNSTGHNVRVYNMPVYYSNQTYRANIIFFGGRRWVLTSELGLFNDTEAQLKMDPETRFFPEKTADMLNDHFHAHFNAKHTTFFLSDAVDFETPDFLPTPSGVGWWTVKVMDEEARLYEPDRRVDAMLTCSDCRADHGGSCDSSGGTCNETTGICECISGRNGHKCENQQRCYEMDRPCHGDGVCDDISGKCRCILPFYGKLCDFPFYCFEEYGACRNGGLCNFTSGFCDCPEDPAISGWACEKRKDCKHAGCENAGICDEITGVCDCPEPYEGLLCSLINETKREELCQANITLENESLCSDHFNCTVNGCRNDGICHNETGLCECPNPYIGLDCSEVPACSVDEDCIGGGWCEWWSGSCSCDNVYASGKRCEITAFSGCDVDGCLNRGICGAKGWCECNLPYTGPRCEDILAEEAYT